MTHPIILVPASKLTKSPSNVRRASDADADAQLRANIAARGVLQNLIGVPVARKKGQYRITAGGRRLDCVHALIEDGTFPLDYELPVMVVADQGDMIEISMSENFFKLDMNPGDACRAFQDIIETERKTPADVAKRFGLTERFVQGRLRLAGLAEPVFEALREGDITLDVAMAYASTADIMRQAAVFEQRAGCYDRNNVHQIRRALAQGSYRGDDLKARLVGRDAYVAAGGRIESDLFSSADDERWIDGLLLDQLAEAHLTKAANVIRAREGFAEIRVVPAAAPGWSETSSLRVVAGEPIPASPEDEARIEAIRKELDAVEADAEAHDGYSAEQEARIETLEEELGKLVDRPVMFSDEQKAGALAYVVIGEDGQPCVYDELYVAPIAAETDEEADGADTAGALLDDDGAATGQTAVLRPAISQKLGDELAMMKTELLAVHVASNGQFALDLGIFLMAENAVGKSYGGLPSDLRATAPTPRVHGFESGMAAAEAWAKLEGGLDRSWLDYDDVTDRYDAFYSLDDAERAAWLGWCIARTLHAVPAGHRSAALLDHLGAKLAIDAVAWWRPTARCFFDRMTKPQILDLLGEVAGIELRQRYATARKHDLAAAAEKLFAGDLIVEADVRERAITWLPDAMTFASTKTPTETCQGQVLSETEQAEDLAASSDASEGETGDLPQAA